MDHNRLGLILRELEYTQKVWSGGVFGDGGPLGSLRHLGKEVLEAEASPKDLMEYADMLILLMDATWRAGYEIADVIEAANVKMKINKLRKWPPKIDGQPCEHIKEKSDA